MKAAPASPRFVASLALVLAGFAIVSAIDCHYPHDWWLENVLVVCAIVYLWGSYRGAPLSRLSYVLVLVFLGLHEIGAHSTFAEVPYNDWSRRLSGVALNDLMGWERNHYDRLVHFSYGFLLALPYKETIDHRLKLRDFASCFVTWIFILATSAGYELIEWAAALVFGGNLGQAYLGTQGDVWDSHKDTGLAVLGATITLVALGPVKFLTRRAPGPAS